MYSLEKLFYIDSYDRLIAYICLVEGYFLIERIKSSRFYGTRCGSKMSRPVKTP